MIQDQSDKLLTAANALADETDSDVYLYNAGIRRNEDDNLIETCSPYRRRTNVILILVTEGGDPDAAYRIARFLQTHYKKFTCLVAGYCKSAGTLIAVGAHELVIGDAAELGPLDVQMSKRDELWESQSGLTVSTALTALHQSSFQAFEHFFMSIKQRSDNAVTLKTATEIAAKLTAGLFTPIYQQIDPMFVGEAQRAQAIAQQYGRRLAAVSRNITYKSLDSLIGVYPTHSFVIDRMEAQALFKKVRVPSSSESMLIKLLGTRATEPASNTENYYLSTEMAPPEENGNDTANPEHSDDHSAGGSDGASDAPTG